MGATCSMPLVNDGDEEGYRRDVDMYTYATNHLPKQGYATNSFPKQALPNPAARVAGEYAQLKTVDEEPVDARIEVEEQKPPTVNAHAIVGRKHAPVLLGAPVRAPLQFKQIPSLLGPVNILFKAALGGALSGSVEELNRQPLVDGFEAFSAALDSLGGSMGGYITTNTKKLRSSKVKSTSDGYREWMFSELPIHSASKSTSYADPSAWIANIWIAWTLEFFVEMFALIHNGTETKTSAETAYGKTLKQHHNFFQSTAFSQMALKKLPSHDAMYNALRGNEGAKAADVHRDLGEFVAMGRQICKFCVKLNTELESALRSELKRK